MANRKAGRWADGQAGRWKGKLLPPYVYLPLGLLIMMAVCRSVYLPTPFFAQVKSSTPVSRSPQQAFILRSTTNEVDVDVRVYDKSGKPVTDLKQSDFRVTEDGVQQTISHFSLEDVEKLAQVNGGVEKAQIIDLAKLPPEVNAEQVLQDHRLLVFFFDISSMQPDELMRALKASSDFVTNRMTRADLIAVVTYSSSLRVTQDFTNNGDSIKKALRAILVGEESSNLATQGSIGEAGGTDANGMEIVTQDVSDAFAPDETEFNIFNTDEKLEAVEALANMLRSVPGRKSVIHFRVALPAPARKTRRRCGLPPTRPIRRMFRSTRWTRAGCWHFLPAATPVLPVPPVPLSIPVRPTPRRFPPCRAAAKPWPPSLPKRGEGLFTT